MSKNNKKVEEVEKVEEESTTFRVLKNESDTDLVYNPSNASKPTFRLKAGKSKRVEDPGFAEFLLTTYGFLTDITNE